MNTPAPKTATAPTARSAIVSVVIAGKALTASTTLGKPQPSSSAGPARFCMNSEKSAFGATGAARDARRRGSAADPKPAGPPTPRRNADRPAGPTAVVALDAPFTDAVTRREANARRSTRAEARAPTTPAPMLTLTPAIFAPPRAKTRLSLVLFQDA